MHFRSYDPTHYKSSLLPSNDKYMKNPYQPTLEVLKIVITLAPFRTDTPLAVGS